MVGAPFYQDASCAIYHGDWREVLPAVTPMAVDMVLTDPPWGAQTNTDSSRFSGGGRERGRSRDDWGPIIGDDQPFDHSPWLDFPRVVLWGANHFAARLLIGTWLVWLKRADHLFGTFLSDAELGWMKGGHGVYAFRKQFPPPSRMVETFGKVAHPTQKPERLMQWCIEKSGCPRGGLILDPFMGSGTTLRAAADMGCKAIGIEIEERYCVVAAKRMAQKAMPW